MGRKSVSGAAATRFFIVFTDVDGTLLDEHTYGWEEAREALDACKGLLIPVILASSKTRAELEALRKDLSLSDPFITENGGGVFIPDGGCPGGREGGLLKWVLGTPYSDLVRSFREIREETCLRIRGFSDMNLAEISALTGLSEEASRLAAMREYDEPFVFSEPIAKNRGLLVEAAQKRGLAVTEGGRFYHLHGNNDKGRAMERVLAYYRERHERVVSIALGDSPNDFSMLEHADYPVLIRSDRNFPELKLRIPFLRRTRAKGPKGWREAVMAILKENREVWTRNG